MKLNYSLLGLGVLLLSAAVFFFIRRGNLVEDAAVLESKREQLAIERKPEDRGRYLSVMEASSRMNSDIRTAGIMSIACVVIGLGTITFVIVRLRRRRRPTLGDEASA